MDSPSRLSAQLPLGGPGFELVEKVARTVERHQMLQRGEHVLVAVSGGPDSMCLLDVLRRLSTTLELRLSIAHVDHGISESSAATGARVAKHGADAGIEVHYVSASGVEGPNLHARARDLRYGFFEEVALGANADSIATGHTLDDRVETTLLRLVHGAGTDGLAGIPPVEGRRIRPLIDVRRSEARSYCAERDLWFVDDPANNDIRFERARIRTSVIPALEEGWGDGGIRAAAVSSERLREDALALRELAEPIFRDLGRRTDDATAFPRAPFVALPRALQRRLLEAAVGRVRDRSGGIDAVLDALDRDRTQSGARFSLPGGREVVIERDEIVVGASPSTSS